MKAIEFTTEEELDLADSAKLEAYQQNVDNAAGFERFSSKIEKDGKWYMAFNPDLSEYFTAEEIERIVVLTFEELL